MGLFFLLVPKSVRIWVRQESSQSRQALGTKDIQDCQQADRREFPKGVESMGKYRDTRGSGCCQLVDKRQNENVRKDTRGYRIRRVSKEQYEQNKKAEHIAPWRLKLPLDKKLDTRFTKYEVLDPKAKTVLLVLDVTKGMEETFNVLKENIQYIVDTIEVDVPNVWWSIMAIGDANYDYMPIQWSGYVRGKELPDLLNRIYFEGGGGPNNWESYSLAWWAGYYKTDLPFFFLGHKLNQDVRNTAYRYNTDVLKNNIIITIGDSMLNRDLPKKVLNKWFGTVENGNTKLTGVNYPTKSFSIYANAKEKFDIYHIAVNVEDYYGTKNFLSWQLQQYPERLEKELKERDKYNEATCPNFFLGQKVKDSFGATLKENLFFCQNKNLPKTIIDIVSLHSDNTFVYSPAEDRLMWIRYRYTPSNSYTEKLYSGY